MIIGPHQLSENKKRSPLNGIRNIISLKSISAISTESIAKQKYGVPIGRLQGVVD
jgi:hypothetical protein